jgi:hypothetical protein
MFRDFFKNDAIKYIKSSLLETPRLEFESLHFELIQPEWEYIRVNPTEEILNEFGKEGWEAVCTVRVLNKRQGIDHDHVVMKRRIK